MIEITGVDLKKFVQEVYKLSRPQGMGYLHYKDGDLPENQVAEILARGDKSKQFAVSMDYVLGRACKMTVHRQGDKLFINDGWFDHDPSDLQTLLSRIKQGTTP